MNQCNFVGRLTKDMEYKVSQSGVATGKSTLAVNRPFKNSQGGNDADFINFIAFRKTADLLSQYVFKGDQVGLSGRMQTRTYENQEGRTVYVTELVVDQVSLISNNRQQGQQGGPQGGYNNQSGPNPQGGQNNSYTNAYGGQGGYNNRPPQGNQGGYNNQAPPQNQYQDQNPFQNANGPVDIDDSDLPF
jgi:single-strand DNA-binding protein